MRLLFSTLFLAAASLSAAPPMYDPALSPNHGEIAFISGGDIWSVPAAGGEARLLVSHPATESRPLYSPDGERLAFVSTRTGVGDIYVLELKTGDLRRITFDDSRAALDAWSADGKYLYFTSNRAEVGSMNDIFKVPSAGGTPVAVTAERYADESQAAVNPVNGSVAFVRGNMAYQQWWRKGHAHIDETRIAVLNGGAYQTVLDNQAKNLWPMWSASGKELYFVSDKSGAENVWSLVPGGAPKQITKFNDGRVLGASISRDGKAIVFERDFRIWKLDVDSGKAAPVEIALRGTPAGAAVSHLSLTQGFNELALSPDGKKIAFVAHGEVFAASAKDGGTAQRLTTSAADETDISWSPDGKQVLYVSDRGGVEHLFVYDFAKEQETQLTNSPLKDEKPVWSPDGRHIAWVRDGRQIETMEVATQQEKLVAATTYRTMMDAENPLAWSPDGQWIAMFLQDSRGFSNVGVVPAAGGKPAQQISFLANSFADRIVWGPDRTYLLFDSGQRTEQRSIVRLDLIPRTPAFREDQFRELFKDAEGGSSKTKEESAAPKKPVDIVFEQIRDRAARLPLGLDANSEVISPDGKTLLFTAASAGQQNLYTWPLDPLATQPPVARQLTSTAGRKSHAQFSPDGKEVFYLDGGRINTVTVESRAVRPVNVTAEMDVDFAAEKREVFSQAWTTLNETYYDPAFHGANWAALKEKFGPVIESVRTPDEMRRMILLMIGEMNSSHSGISASNVPPRTPTTGRLGITVDPSDFTITEVIPLGPAGVAGIRKGEKLLAVNGTDLTPGSNIDELLQYQIGKRTLISTSAHKDVAVQPVNTVTEKRLIYRAWVEGRRAAVDQLSGGRLGYVHMLDMSAQSLDQLYLDLDAENHSREGVIIDIRNNTGGFVNAYALDVFTRRPYLTMTQRDHPAQPARSVLGQRALELPTVLVVNQNSLSDAEDFTEGYRTLKLGKVVGVPTAGWIIYTDSAVMIDGSVLRTPMVKVQAHDGVDMELHPRPVDVTVDNAIGDGMAGKDPQLEMAVKTLLGEIGSKK